MKSQLEVVMPVIVKPRVPLFGIKKKDGAYAQYRCWQASRHLSNSFGLSKDSQSGDPRKDPLIEREWERGWHVGNP